MHNDLTIPPEMCIRDILQNGTQIILFALLACTQKKSNQISQRKAGLQIYAIVHSTRGIKALWKERELLSKGLVSAAF